MSRPLADESVFRAIGHSARRAVLVLLREGELPAGDIVKSVRLGRTSMSEHLRMLRSAGLITQRRIGRRRVYRLKPQSLRQISQWVARFDH